MLTCLHVRNIALIEEITLNLHHHLNIFSGETGAGKSMLIDSIQFAIGNRTSKQIIRKGEQCAYVRLTFEDDKGLGIAYLEENGYPYTHTTIEMERILYVSGRTVYKINGITCNRQVVKDLAALLIDVHGQHEPQSLLDVSTHVHMLDSFGDEKFLHLKEAYKTHYERLMNLKNELSKISTDDRKKLQLQDMLEFQINEIAACKLKTHEEEELKSQYEILSHAEKILMQCQKAYDALEADGHHAGAIELVGKATQHIQDVSHINEELGSLHARLLAVEADLQDITYQVRRFADQIEYSPELLQEIQTRLDTIYRLKQKYGSSISEILVYKQNCEKELEELLGSTHNKEKLEQEIADLENKLNTIALELTEGRKNIAESIEVQINEHLHDLQMPHAQFKVAIQQSEMFNRNGQDEVEFLIRTNLGEDMHGLAKIASGGEISRVMLAIKTVLVLGDSIETVIFDEIDTGISGLAAQKVGEKLAVISRARQVICITHLPQIAAMGDRNYLIEKSAVDNQTKTQLMTLPDDKLQEELCRLMGGFITESTLKSAKELKESANRYKQGIA
ncbi:DNA repair protein RecN [Zhenhengia yiwuensis]|uniref:DNA repair protein RecN n=1 Tax=Zhenhengia yiwuensis TaxID=2763666 RepID=A0A926EDL3_9FIRM|nr:DNA repair protein RecN [Zhenhengia yiwuensis]MBC8578344.1 DNA repair protein RecN [Zhenhengia yiwuensis]